MNEILKTLLQSVRELNIKLSDIDEELNSTKSEVVGFETEYQKEIKHLQESIEYLNTQIYETIQKEIKKIPKPADGKSIEFSTIKEYLDKEFNKLKQKRELEQSKIKEQLIEIVSDIEIPKDGKDGRDGKNAEAISYDKIQADLYSWLDKHKSEFKGETGEKGSQGFTGKTGADGRSITDVTVEKDMMIIYFSNGTTKEIKLPKKTVYVGGGGGGSSTAKTTTYDNRDSNGLTSKNVKDALDELSNASGGVSDLVFKNRTFLEDLFNSAYTTAFKKITRADSNITDVDVYDDEAETTHLFNKSINYLANGNVNNVIITNKLTNQTLTKTMSYDSNNDVVNVSEIVG